MNDDTLKSARAFDEIVDILNMHGADRLDVVKQVEALWRTAHERSRNPYDNRLEDSDIQAHAIFRFAEMIDGSGLPVGGSSHTLR